MDPRDSPSRGQERAAALVIVLAFVVLVTGLVVAFLSRTQTDRAVAHGSFNQAKVDHLAESAADIIVGDLRQEIVNGSNAPVIIGTTSIYTPISNANMLPQRSGNPPPVSGIDPIPNLVRVSVHSDTIALPGVGSRASDVNSTTDVSPNGRSVSLARWNSHYLIPRTDWSDTKIDSTPLSPVAPPTGPGDTTGFTPPDWVILTRSGPAPFTAWNPDLADRTKDNYAVGRYAYAIYNEGGLLDVNVAGYPSPSPTPTPPSSYITDYGRKGVLAFADLSALPTSTASPNPATLSSAAVNSIVGWRNFATTQQPNSSPFPNNFSFNSSTTTLYDQFALGRTNGFMEISGAVWTKPSSNPNPRTDQPFLSRQYLLDFRRSTDFSQNALQYMGTFSREAEANAPQWIPTAADAINPNFQTLRVTASFTRNDGTTATRDEYLVNKRFLLQRLNWLTYKGPSASRVSTDPDISILTGTYGVALSFLQQGTAANILKYFGLAWDVTNERWNYVGHSGGSALAMSLATLSTLTGTREPDFFELLQAGIISASLGDSSGNPPQAPTPVPTATPSVTPTPTPTPTPTVPPTPPPNTALPIAHQQSKPLQILTIGANLLAQARTDSYPVRIAFSNGGTEMEAIGASRLPYINALAACAVGATQAAGGLHWMLLPNLWNPFRNSWDLTEATTSTPLYPRPPIRIRLDGSAAFGSVTASTLVKSGSAVSADVTVFTLGSLTVATQTLALTSLDSGHGRDGFREASRLRTGDPSIAVTQFTTTNSPTTSFAEWNSLTTTAMSGSERYIVFRLSLAGSSIPASAFLSAQNPVLVLKPGFRVVLEYQSPTGAWHPYSFLQGNSASSTWIGNTSPTPQNLNLVTDYSTYGKVGTIPTIVNSGTSTATPWALATLIDAPMFAKGDPRSIRYNNQIGVISLPAAAAAPTPSAGVIGSIWPNAYTTLPVMSPDLNPAIYSQVTGDNAAAASNPYSELSTKGDPVRPIVMNRPFRSVGEMGYAFRDQPFKTLDFSSTASPDAGLLDLFSVNEYNDSSGQRAGVVNLNGQQGGTVNAILSRTIAAEGIAGAPAPSPSVIPSASASSAGKSLAAIASSKPLINRAGLPSFIASETGLGASVPKTQREAIARAFGEVVQTRTWNLMIDVIAQSGRYAPGETDLKRFIVEGEQRYWVHVAIDRFTGQVIDRQIEVVKE